MMINVYNTSYCVQKKRSKNKNRRAVAKNKHLMSKEKEKNYVLQKNIVLLLLEQQPLLLIPSLFAYFCPSNLLV